LKAGLEHKPPEPSLDALLIMNPTSQYGVTSSSLTNHNLISGMATPFSTTAGTVTPAPICPSGPMLHHQQQHSVPNFATLADQQPNLQSSNLMMTSNNGFAGSAFSQVLAGNRCSSGLVTPVYPPRVWLQ